MISSNLQGATFGNALKKGTVSVILIWSTAEALNISEIAKNRTMNLPLIFSDLQLGNTWVIYLSKDQLIRYGDPMHSETEPIKRDSNIHGLHTIQLTSTSSDFPFMM